MHCYEPSSRADILLRMLPALWRPTRVRHPRILQHQSIQICEPTMSDVWMLEGGNETHRLACLRFSSVFRPIRDRPLPFGRRQRRDALLEIRSCRRQSMLERCKGLSSRVVSAPTPLLDELVSREGRNVRSEPRAEFARGTIRQRWST
jgi:hypothetical protein